MKYKVSAFNYTINDDRNALLFNAASGALLNISREKHAAFARAVKCNTLPEFLRLNPEFKKGRFVLQETTDELARLALKYERERFNDKILALTLCPTLACNFKCTYCYQDPAIQKGEMTDKLEKRLIEFVRMYLTQVEHVNLQWYGGEPLLQLQRVISITKQINTLCKKMKKTFDASITTNGYLLTDKVGKALAGAGIRSAQVTLDGPPDIHDKRRPLKSGEGSFDTILRNVISNQKRLNISLRVNIDADNAKHLRSICAILKAHKLESNAYFAPVRGKVLICSDAAGCGSPDPFSFKKFANVEAESFKELRNMKVLRKKLRSRPSFCSAPSMKFLVVDPEGWLYKCWHSVGNPDERIGSLFFYNKIALNDTHVKWLTYSPLRNKKCRKCSVLPLCIGGCPHTPLFQPGDGKPQCEPILYNLPHLVRLAAKV